LDSLAATFKDPVFCDQNPATNATANRNSAINELQKFCSTLPSSDCSTGLSNELNRCGFAFPDDNVKYCNSNVDDCCQPKPNVPLIAGLCVLAALVLALISFFAFRKKLLPVVRHLFNSANHETKYPKPRDSDLPSLNEDAKTDGGLPLYAPSYGYKTTPVNSRITSIFSNRHQSLAPKRHPKKHKAVEAYTPTMSDEILVREGDCMLVDEIYDDGILD
jgi:hypothetical protein